MFNLCAFNGSRAREIVRTCTARISTKSKKNNDLRRVLQEFCFVPRKKDNTIDPTSVSKLSSLFYQSYSESVALAGVQDLHVAAAGLDQEDSPCHQKRWCLQKYRESCLAFQT